MTAQKLCGREVVLEIPRKLTCASSFCNVGGRTTQILMELSSTKMNNLAKVSFLKLLTKENVLACSY